MDRPTLREENNCHSCGYVWFPRGHHQSLKCPACGHNRTFVEKVEYVTHTPDSDYNFPLISTVISVVVALCFIVPPVVISQMSPVNDNQELVR